MKQEEEESPKKMAPLINGLNIREQEQKNTGLRNRQ